MKKEINYDDLKYYSSIGFKSGLEIHHQLDTKKKLFCRCPVGYRHIKPNARIVRHMRPTLSEMGTYDGTALMEFKTKKEVNYLLYRDYVCTYEMDDTPPFPINDEALDYAIEIALMLNCQLVDEVHITRKQYLDGSIPTGFQRTAIIGIDGWIPYKGRKIRVQQLAIEEDSCREVSDIGHQITFKTDRLGTPLIEIVTYPDMKTPQECAEVGELLGRLLRASGRVRRGMGSARQDVNSSITGGPRIEIKGVPKTWYIPALLTVEIKRQQALLTIRDRLLKNGLSYNEKLNPSLREDERLEELDKLKKGLVTDVTHLLTDTSFPEIKDAIGRDMKVWALKLEQFGDNLTFEVQPGETFGDEFAGRIRVIACLDKMPNMIWLSAGILYPGDWESIQRELSARPNDEIVLIWGNNGDLEVATNEIILRANEALEGIPEETRQHMQDGIHTDFERILPGPDRMYPDTDSPPVRILDERRIRIQKCVSERPWEREERYEKLGIHKSVSWKLAIHPRAELFDKLVKIGFKPTLSAELIVNWLTHLRRETKTCLGENMSDDVILDVVATAIKKRLPKESIKNELNSLASDKKYIWQHPELANDKDINFIVDDVFARAEEINFNLVSAKKSWIKGRIMRSLYGRIDGKKVSEIVDSKITE